MKITARCHPALEPLLPKPVPAARGLPRWLKDMPDEVAAESLGGAAIRTLKHCPPMIDAMRQGILILNPVDLHVKDGELSWSWDPPMMPDSAITRAPIGVHVPEQATGSPWQTDHLILKFINFWTLKTEPGWSLWFHHPTGYLDLPFKTLSGVVDTDLFCDGYVHFPAILRSDFNGVIEMGTPVAQVVPVQKDCTLEVGAMTPDEIAQNRAVQEDLGSHPGVYRRKFKR